MFSFYSTGCKESQQHALAQKSFKLWTSLLNKVVLDIHYLFNTRVWVTIDYMHSTLLGVVKMLVNLWFDKQHHNIPWYTGKCAREVQERDVKPPSCISRLPRNLIASVGYLKDSQLQSFTSPGFSRKFWSMVNNLTLSTTSS